MIILQSCVVSKLFNAMNFSYEVDSIFELLCTIQRENQYKVGKVNLEVIEHGNRKPSGIRDGFIHPVSRFEFPINLCLISSEACISERKYVCQYLLP